MDVLVSAYQDLDAAQMDVGAVVEVAQARPPANRWVPNDHEQERFLDVRDVW